jgi:hypothetical protein
LPWYLTPLQAQGFLGRLLAQRLAASGVAIDPERWDLESVLFAATHLQDAPGALALGEPGPAPTLPIIPAGGSQQAQVLDETAADVARTLPAGSSAGGEQPKFLAHLANPDGSLRQVLVKFSPPVSTPFGARWNDLLQAEALALEVLAAHGVPVARTRIVRSQLRTYLISERFDRIGASGRRHVVSIGAAHRAFVAGPYGHWGLSCAQLVAQGGLRPATTHAHSRCSSSADRSATPTCTPAISGCSSTPRAGREDASRSPRCTTCCPCAGGRIRGWVVLPTTLPLSPMLRCERSGSRACGEILGDTGSPHCRKPRAAARGRGNVPTAGSFDRRDERDMNH